MIAGNNAITCSRNEDETCTRAVVHLTQYHDRLSGLITVLVKSQTKVPPRVAGHPVKQDTLTKIHPVSLSHASIDIEIIYC